MAETISVRKTIPASSYYTGSGDTTIILDGVIELNWNVKKALIKVNKPQTKSKQTSNPSDKFDSRVVDIKRGEETCEIKGYLVDDASETAWSKWFKLRAMCVRGGELAAFNIGGISFTSSSTQAVFIESVTITRRSDGTVAINEQVDNTGFGIARLEFSMTLFFGNER